MIEAIFTCLIATLLMVVSVFFNVLQIRVIYKTSRRTLTVENIPVINLSVICIYISCTALPCIAFFSFQNLVTPVTPILCRFRVIGCFHSVILLLMGFFVIATERFLSVVFPYYHRSRITKTIVKKWCVGSWILIYVYVFFVAGIADSPFKEDSLSCLIDMRILLVTCLLALVIVVITVSFYIKIIKIAHSRIAPNGATPQNTQQLKRAYVMLGLFLVSTGIWLPIIICSLFVHFLVPSVHYDFKLFVTMFGFTSMNSNFVIHWKKYKSFRQESKAFFHNVFHQRCQKNLRHTQHDIQTVSASINTAPN